MFRLATVFKYEHRPSSAITNTQKVIQRFPKNLLILFILNGKNVKYVGVFVFSL